MDDVLFAISDRTRRAILDTVVDREAAAGEIAARFPGISRPAVSQHIAVLRDSGLLHERRQGRHRYYRVDPEPLRVVWEEWLSRYERYWDERLTALKAVVEGEEAGK